MSACQSLDLSASPSAPLFALRIEDPPESLSWMDWEFLNEEAFLGMNFPEWVGLLLFVAISYLAGVILHELFVRVGKMISKRTEAEWDDDFLALLPGPLRLFLTLFILSQLLTWLGLRQDVDAFLHSILSCGLVGALIWFSLRFLKFGSKIAERYFTQGIEATSQARAIHTQVTVVSGIVQFLLIVVGVALALMQFEVARNLGVSLLASAGIATAAIGFASQKTIATMFAGIQIAFSQTIKIDDVVVVEGEWGRIEDIRLTYVVVRIWDLRRLIVPVTYFTDNSFENWTAKSPEVLGTVYVYTDYTVSVDEIREELQRILDNEGKDLWDGQTSGVVVTNLTSENAEVRVLVSAKDSSDIWNLRCLVREKMLTWLQTRGKKHLPRHRVQPESISEGENGENSASLLVPKKPEGDG